MKPVHRWVRHPAKVFVLRCGDCGQTWRADKSEPKGECVPGPDKALAS